MVEETDLFVRGVGEGSEIVGKQMYTFDDKKGRSLTLRPEKARRRWRARTCSTAWASWPQPVKVFYMGPYFRYERPQAGRYRQFHQIGAELIGDPGPYSDVELLVMLLRFLEELGFRGPGGGPQLGGRSGMPPALLRVACGTTSNRIGTSWAPTAVAAWRRIPSASSIPRRPGERRAAR